MAASHWAIAPYFLMDDVVATANYYRDRLGFQYERFWGEPPAFCMVYRRGVIIMLSQLEARGAMRPNHVSIPRAARGTPTSGWTMPTRCSRSSSPAA